MMSAIIRPRRAADKKGIVKSRLSRSHRKVPPPFLPKLRHLQILEVTFGHGVTDLPAEKHPDNFAGQSGKDR